jgi:hypothetical protein
MCAACVAQGIGYVGGAVGSLRVMAGRASTKRRRGQGATTSAGSSDQLGATPRHDAVQPMIQVADASTASDARSPS